MRWVFRMAAVATLLVLSSPCSAQIVFNEILIRNSAGDHTDQMIELRNSGSSSVNLSGWILSHLGDNSAILPGGTVLSPGNVLLVHFNEGGSNSPSEIYFPGRELSDISDLALYAANTVMNGGFTNPDNIRAFIQWGGVPTQGRQSVAQAAGLWSSNTYLPLPPAGYSMELCNGTGVSPSGYTTQAVPTLGTNNSCSVATSRVSWSRVKDLYR
jgi:hypothetical protein